MKLKLLWDKSLPEPEVTVASAPEDDEATRILEALQSAAGSTFAYVEKAGTPKERVPFACICSLEASGEGGHSPYEGWQDALRGSAAVCALAMLAQGVCSVDLCLLLSGVIGIAPAAASPAVVAKQTGSKRGHSPLPDWAAPTSGAPNAKDL